MKIDFVGKKKKKRESNALLPEHTDIYHSNFVCKYSFFFLVDFCSEIDFFYVHWMFFFWGGGGLWTLSCQVRLCWHFACIWAGFIWMSTIIWLVEFTSPWENGNQINWFVVSIWISAIDMLQPCAVLHIFILKFSICFHV